MLINNIFIKYKEIIITFLFSLICAVCLYISYNYKLGTTINIYTSILMMLILIHLFKETLNNKYTIYENKRCILVFIIILLLFIITWFSFKFTIYKKYVDKNQFYLFLVLYTIFNSFIFICYFFKIKLSNFKWNINLKWIFIVFTIFIFGKILDIICNYRYLSNNLSFELVLSSAVKILFDCFYPGFFEEVLYRGFLISGLKGLKLDEWKCNIIQAVIFGIIHVLNFDFISLQVILSTAFQAFMGYMFGKLYFKTKSLTPCIILHALWDGFIV